MIYHNVIIVKVFKKEKKIISLCDTYKSKVRKDKVPDHAALIVITPISDSIAWFNWALNPRPVNVSPTDSTEYATFYLRSLVLPIKCLLFNY